VREIAPKRDTWTGELYHYCPLTLDKITTDKCEECEFRERIDWKTSKYIVHCRVPSEVELVTFDPPKAHDEVGPYSGMEVVESSRHIWVEPKLDGARALVHLTPNGVFITSRRREKTGQFKRFQDNVPHLRDDPKFKEIGQHGYTILDGEVIVPKEGDTLAATMSVVGALPDYALLAQRRLGLAHLHLFDVVYANGEDVSNFSLQRRREILRDIPTNDHVHLVPFHEAKTAEEKLAVLDVMWGEGYEGIVLKDPRAAYKASRAWLKVKQRVTLDCQIVDWKFGAPGTKYEETLGSLTIAVKNTGGKLVPVADVIPGDDETRERLFRHYASMSTEQVIAENKIVEVMAQLITKDGALRHPRILRWREDRSEPNMLDL
jgi:ATP-dependent DNA ligase